MNARLVVPAIAGLMLLSTAAFAKGDFPAREPHNAQNLVKAEQALQPYDHCIALQQQFDNAVATHGNADKIGDAKQLRASAGKACGGNEFAAGIRDLRLALFDIGVTPQS